MDMLKIIFPISDFLYLLQLEEYESKRYFKTIKRLFWKRNLQKRGKLVETKRIKITRLVSLPFCIVLFPLTPWWIGLANVILNPYFENIKQDIQHKAKEYFANKNTKTKVIAIAGSFGKTTTKNYIYELIRYNYKTQMIPGNINTPTGIANWILKDYDPSSEILLVEADSYYIGEIGKSLTITPPDIAILTNVGDQHLERLESKANLEKALNEVFEFAKPNAINISNKDSALEYALEVAKVLDIPKDIINSIVKKLAPPDRRGNLVKLNGFEVIDNSYNISETTAKLALLNASKIAKEKDKKLVVITAGIPELGKENKKGNIHLGEMLDKYADNVVLLRSILYPEVESGIKNKAKIIYTDNLNQSWKSLESYDSKNYLILLFPELNDLYYE